jgi:hypothetical protein
MRRLGQIAIFDQRCGGVIALEQRQLEDRAHLAVRQNRRRGKMASGLRRTYRPFRQTLTSSGRVHSGFLQNRKGGGGSHSVEVTSLRRMAIRSGGLEVADVHD